MHANVCLSGQRIAAAEPHAVMSQSSVPATPAFGHSTTHFASSAHVVRQGPAAHVKEHVLPEPQVQLPFAHVPVQLEFCPSHATWQGGVEHSKEQLAPCSHVHVPLEHVPEHEDPDAQSTWHGGASHVKPHWSFCPQTQVPFEQSALESQPTAILVATRIARSARER